MRPAAQNMQTTQTGQTKQTGQTPPPANDAPAAAPAHLELTRLLRFEADFEPALPCIPMAVRLKLDLAGIKLTIKDWYRLGEADRRALLQQPCDGPAHVETFGALVRARVHARCGHLPEALPVPPLPPWDDLQQIPGDLLEKATAEGLMLDPPRWASLTRLQRFALVKLSRPRHHNRNFLPAFREFGLV